MPNTITIQVDNLSLVSDGYHTIDELYDHRCRLYIAMCAFYDSLPGGGQSVYWKRDPGTAGWFLLYLESPAGQISYHLPDKYLEQVQRFARHSPDHEWDGHTSEQVMERLSRLADMAGYF